MDLQVALKPIGKRRSRPYHRWSHAAAARRALAGQGLQLPSILGVLGFQDFTGFFSRYAGLDLGVCVIYLGA